MALVDIRTKILGKRYSYNGVGVTVTHLDEDPYTVIATHDFIGYYPVNLRDLRAITNANYIFTH